MTKGLPGIISLLCDPVSYYRPWKRSRDAMPPNHRAGLNEFLVRHYLLPTWSSYAQHALLVAKLVQVWHRLEDVAFLIACGKNADWVVSQREAICLPPHAHQFLRMGFKPHDDAVMPTGVDVESLVAWGGQYLQRLNDRLPAWMAARLTLPFVGLDQPGTCGVGSPDMTCLWMAINHVSLDSTVRPRDRR